MAKTLLLISARQDDQDFAAEVAIAAGMSLSVEPDMRAAVKILETEGAEVVFVDTSDETQYREFESILQDTVGLFSDRVNANRIHFLCDLELEGVKFLIQSPVFGSYVMRNYEDPKVAGKRYGGLVRATLGERAFGLANILQSTSKIQTVKLKRSGQKQEAVEAVKNYLMAAKFKSRMATVVANAVDELLMNAIFDAPVDDLGKPLFPMTSRATDFELKDRHEVEMHVGFDNSYVGITAVDLFGSLDKVKLMTHISKVYTEEEYKIKTTTAGAGIGLATVFRSGGSFLFSSERHVRTEVTVFFRKTDNFREFKDQFRFIATQFYF